MPVSVAVVKTHGERWRLERFDGEDEVLVEVERNGHNFAPSLDAREVGALIDALLAMMPEAREHSVQIGGAK